MRCVDEASRILEYLRRDEKCSGESRHEALDGTLPLDLGHVHEFACEGEHARRHFKGPSDSVAPLGEPPINAASALLPGSRVLFQLGKGRTGPVPLSDRLLEGLRAAFSREAFAHVFHLLDDLRELRTRGGNGRRLLDSREPREESACQALGVCELLQRLIALAQRPIDIRASALHEVGSRTVPRLEIFAGAGLGLLLLGFPRGQFSARTRQLFPDIGQDDPSSKRGKPFTIRLPLRNLVDEIGAPRPESMEGAENLHLVARVDDCLMGLVEIVELTHRVIRRLKSARLIEHEGTKELIEAPHRLRRKRLVEELLRGLASNAGALAELRAESGVRVEEDSFREGRLEPLLVDPGKDDADPVGELDRIRGEGVDAPQVLSRP
ncbi:hypothetical protein [Actinomyces culturomici]|uniref:hypothetical protein n=1 Tax=Actinomyces culturomici TaxID=1926276 RepID=UPI001F373772|nr:hypothetical protein [Actinomyces culturomici]